MRIEPVDAATLRAVVLKDLDAIRGIEVYARSLVREAPSRAEVESLGFALHNLYNALENSFTQISLTFENHVKDRNRWHRELLEKMFLAVPPIRPAILPSDLSPTLLDLLGFRHLFRHSYEFTLDPAKTVALFQRWETAAPRLRAGLEVFADQLGQAATSAGPS